MEFACDDISGEGRSDGKLLLKGDGSYNTSEQAFTDLRNWGEELRFRLRDGEERVSRNTVIGIGSIVLGHKELVRFAMNSDSWLTANPRVNADLKTAVLRLPFAARLGASR